LTSGLAVTRAWSRASFEHKLLLTWGGHIVCVRWEKAGTKLTWSIRVINDNHRFGVSNRGSAIEINCPNRTNRVKSWIQKSVCGNGHSVLVRNVRTLLVALINYLKCFPIDVQLVGANWKNGLWSERELAYSEQRRENTASQLASIDRNDVHVIGKDDTSFQVSSDTPIGSTDQILGL